MVYSLALELSSKIPEFLLKNFLDKTPEKPSVRKRKPSEKENDIDPNKSSKSLRKGLLSQRRLRMLANPMDSVKTDKRYNHLFCIL